VEGCTVLSGENDPDQILRAENIGGRWGIDILGTDRAEPKLSSYSLTNHTHGCPGVDHRGDRNGSRDRDMSCPESRFHGVTNRNAKLNHRAITLEVGNLYRERRHVRYRGGAC